MRRDTRPRTVREENKRLDKIWEEIHRTKSGVIKLKKSRREHYPFTPAYNSQQHNLDFFLESLEAICEPKTDVFLDTNIILGFCPRKNVFDDFREVADFFKDEHYMQESQRMIDDFHDMADFYGNFLEKPNVHITSGVANEVLGIADEHKKKIRIMIRGRNRHLLLRPVEELERAVKRNNFRLRYRGIETTSLVKAVYSSLPCIIKTKVENPSLADRMLVSVPFASGLKDGREKIVISNDDGVYKVLNYLSGAFTQNPRAVYSSSALPRRFQISVFGFLTKDENCTFERMAGFEHIPDYV